MHGQETQAEVIIMLYAVTPTIQIGGPLLQAAEAIGQRFWTLNAMRAEPVPVSQSVPVSIIARLWGTAEARQQRFDRYARDIGLARRRVTRNVRSILYPSGVTQERQAGDYASIIIIWVGRKIEMPAVQVIGLAETSLNTLNWSRVNYPDAPMEFASDVILSMLGYFGLPEGELLTEEELARQIGPEPTIPVTITTDEELKQGKHNLLIMSGVFLAGILIALSSWRR